jgi:hypothetical protein
VNQDKVLRVALATFNWGLIMEQEEGVEQLPQVVMGVLTIQIQRKMGRVLEVMEVADFQTLLQVQQFLGLVVEAEADG